MFFLLQNSFKLVSFLAYKGGRGRPICFFVWVRSPCLIKDNHLWDFSKGGEKKKEVE